MPAQWIRRSGRWMLDNLWRDRPLRQKLMLGVWLTVVPISLTASLLALIKAQDLTVERLRQQMLWDAAQAGTWFKEWNEDHLKALGLLASIRDIRRLDPIVSREVLAEAPRVFPDRQFSLTRRDGRPIAHYGRDTWLPLDNSAGGRALSGIPSSALLPLNRGGANCFQSSVPVYGEDRPHQQAPVAVLSSCIDERRIGLITGVTGLMQGAGYSSSGIQQLDLAHARVRGYGVLLVFHAGQSLLLESGPGHRSSTPSRQSNAAWKPFIQRGLAAKTSREFELVQVNSRPYYLAINRQDADAISMVIIDQETALAGIHQLVRWIWIGNLLALVVSSIAIHRICSTLSQPIDQVGTMLARMSRGDFNQSLPTRRDDIGELFSHVNRASQQLKDYLAVAQAHAVTQAQLQEARRIQADFLIKTLPSNEHEELCASFDSAYEIGADWYDALEKNGNTYLIVADVCDKGVPSALFMSVFRSLLRLGLGQALAAGQNPEAALLSALTATNDYMAQNHGETGMFATVFIAAYIPDENRLIHLVAGHELPLILRGHALERLPVGGPAIGLFSGSAFQAHSTPFHPGDLLFAYSDGLPDTRNGRGESFGHARLEAVLLGLEASERGAAQVVERFRREVQRFREGAEPFDDLTLLALLARGPQMAKPAPG